MIAVKILEIVDTGTFIPAFAFNVGTAFEIGRARELILRSGWSARPGIYLGRLSRPTECHYDPWSWGSKSRTMPEAHKWIIDNWHSLKSGDLVDVCAILGEEPHGTDMHGCLYDVVCSSEKRGSYEP